jgi:hypothetical protein
VVSQNTRCFNPEFPQPPILADERDCEAGKYFIDPKDPNTIIVNPKSGYGNPAMLSKIIAGANNGDKYFDGKNFLLNVDLLIDVDGATFEGCKFKIKEKVAIAVMPKNKLYTYRSLFWACDKMWKGISVNEGNTFVFVQNTIEDAQYAIRATGKCNLRLQENTFDRNYIGIYASPSNLVFGVPSKTKYPIFEIFNKNTFTTTSPINSPYPGQIPNPTIYFGFAGMKIENMPAVLPNIGVESNVNVFKDICIGILSLKSTLITKKTCIFQNMYFDKSNKQSNGLSFPLETHSDSEQFQLGIGISTKLGSLDFEGLGKNAKTATFLYNSFAAVYARGTNINKLSNCLISWDNKGFSNLLSTGERYGVLSINNTNASSIVVYNNTISHPWGTYQFSPPSTLVVPINFIGVKLEHGSNINNITSNEIRTATIAGIVVDGSKSGTGFVRIDNNKIFNTTEPNFPSVGISVSETKQFRIRLNEIDFNYGYGIYVTNCPTDADNRPSIGNNTITGIHDKKPFVLNPQDPKAPIFSTSTAIFVASSANIRICENILDKTYVGTHFRGDCDHTELSATDYKHHTNSLYLGPTFTKIGEQDRTDNAWYEKFALEFDARMDKNSDPKYSLFFIPAGKTNYSEFPQKISASDKWFLPSTDETVFHCALNPKAPDSPLSRFEQDIVDGIDIENISDVELWEAKRTLVRRALNDGGASSDLADFLASQNNNNTLAFEMAHKLYDEANSLNVTTFATLDEADEALANEVLELLNGQNLDATQLAMLQTKMDQLEVNRFERASLGEGIEKARKQFIQDAMTENGKAKVDSPYAYDEFVLNNIEFYDELYNIEELSDDVLDIVVKIAAKCPKDGGQNVYRARRMLPLCMQIYTDAQCDGFVQIDNEIIEGRAVKTQKSLTIYPNPVQDELTVLLPNSNENAQVQVFDSVGKQMFEGNSEDLGSKFKLSTSQWPNGIYIVRLQRTNNAVETSKFTILH